MADRLAERLRARVTFVVGKGGVGKTTTACALALAAADAGLATHLLSIDPAHSLADVLDEPPAPVARPSRCSAALLVEELDARTRGRRWLDAIRDPLAALMARGTYLDADDVDQFLARLPPGIDEIAAALRLVEIEAGAARRIIVDTAPAGHTLRLLDVPALLDGWVRALQAMADKADAVARGLLGQSATPVAATLVEDLRRAAQDFRERVLSPADFLVVSRLDPAVRTATGRLAGSLRSRGFAPTAELVVVDEVAATGAAGAALTVGVPWMPAPRGCAGLRRLAGALGEAGPARPTEPRETPASATVAPARAGGAEGPLPRRPAFGWCMARARGLNLIVGKGGVGKTTCAAALALALADAGPVTLLGADPAGSLGDVLGLEIPAEGTRLGPLRLRRADPAAELARVRERFAAELEEGRDRMGVSAGAALDRHVLDALRGLAPPGIDEIAALVEMLRDTREGAAVVVDTAPTGHFLRFLEMPDVALDWSHALMRVFLKYRLSYSLDDVVEGVIEFANRLKDLIFRLKDPTRTAAWLVTLPDAVVGAETRRLECALARAGVPIASVVENRAEVGSSRRGPGDLRGRPPAGYPASEVPHLLAPAVAPPPVGRAALLSFIHRWELQG